MYNIITVKEDLTSKAGKKSERKNNGRNDERTVQHIPQDDSRNHQDKRKQRGSSQKNRSLD